MSTETETQEERIDRIARRLEPTPGRIVLSPTSEEETMRGGLHIPATAQEKPVQGIIRSIGPTLPHTLAAITTEADWSQRQAGTKRGQLQVGQKVLFGKYAGTEITVEGEELLILDERDVLAIVHDAVEP